MDPIVYPDAARGISALLRGFHLADQMIRPGQIVPVNYTDQSLPVAVHVYTVNTTTGQIDRVEEVRLTVYGFTPQRSKDLCEAVLSFITGEGVLTPEVSESAEGVGDGAAAFYFDYIHQRTGPAPMPEMSDQVFPVSATVDCRARPMPQ